MENYYKERCEKLETELSRVEHEASFYKKIAWMISGGTSVIAVIAFWWIVISASFFLFDKWNILTISDRVAVITLIFGFISLSIKYRKVILNWQEELYLHELRREKEISELRK
jgi:hypothetical protein